MNQNITEAGFENQKLKKAGVINKLLGTKPIANLKINNILANKAISDISPEELETLAFSYKTKLSKQSELLGELYKEYLQRAISDTELSQQEIANMKTLKQLLMLNDKTVSVIHQSIYTEAVKKTIGDGKLDEKEKLFLERLIEEMQLPESVAQNVYRQNAQVLVQGFVSGIMSDQQISPDEENELQLLAQNLNINLDIDKKSQEILDKYRLFWQIQNGDLPSFEPSIKLQKGELCHFNVSSNYHELRTVTKRINSGGPALSIKIAKGLHWRASSVSSQRITQDILTKLDSGKIYITNKRLIFVGVKSTKSVALDKILDFEAFKNGFTVYKDSGKPFFLEIQDNTDIALMIFGRALRDA
jgi:hypothetical protein